MEAKLRENSRDVDAHRLLGDEKPASDLAVGQPVGEFGEYRPLPGGQR